MLPPCPRVPRPIDGLAKLPGSEAPGWIGAVFLAVLLAGLLEWTAQMAPIPPGGDEGQWLATSYAYVGLPFASQIQRFSYPPLSFPLLGLLVRVANSVTLGDRLYLGFLGLIVPLSAYALSRSLLRSQILAVFATGLIVFEPDFLRLFYFGAYPTLFGIAFLNLGLAAAVRFVRSHRPGFVYLFWLCATVALLSESLVGVVMLASAGVLALFLLVKRELPREIVTTGTGWAGILTFGLGAGAYYVGGRVFHIAHPVYTAKGALNPAHNYFPNLVAPLHLEAFAKLFRGVGFTMSPGVAFEILLAIDLVAVGVFLVFRGVYPRVLTVEILTVTAMFVGVTAVALYAYETGIVTDYRRYTYFIFSPVYLLLFVAFDFLVFYYAHWDRLYADPRRPANRPPPAPGWRPWARWHASSPDRVWRTRASLGVLLVIGLVVAVDLVAVPTMQAYEVQNTTGAHDANFLAIADSIRTSGIPGSVLTNSVQSAKWLRALTFRDAYEPVGPGGFVFSTADLVSNEYAWYALNAHYAITNNQVIVAIPYTSVAYASATPEYLAYWYGTPVGVMQIAPYSIYVQVGSAPPFPVFSRSGGPAPSVALTNPSTLVTTFRGPGYTLSVSATTPPGTASATITVTATATGPTPLGALNATLTAPGGRSARINATNAAAGTDGFSWLPTGFNNLTQTYAQVSPKGTVTGLTSSNRTVPAEVTLHSLPTAGARSLSFTISLTSPQALNVLPSLPPSFVGPQIWGNWSTRFLVFALNGAHDTSTIQNAQALAAEYGLAPWPQGGTAVTATTVSYYLP